MKGYGIATVITNHFGLEISRCTMAGLVRICSVGMKLKIIPNDKK